VIKICIHSSLIGEFYLGRANFVFPVKELKEAYRQRQLRLARGRTPAYPASITPLVFDGSEE
jgi:hypothetical protein